MGRIWDEQGAMRAAVRYVCRERPGFVDGMGWLIGFADEVTESGAWDAARAIDWEGFGAAYVEWFRALVEAHPLPSDTEAIWFETPSDLNPAASLVNAFGKLGPSDSSHGLEDGAIWPEEVDGDWSIGIAALPALERAITGSGFRGSGSERRESLRPGVAVLSAGCVCLLAMEALRGVGVLAQIAHRSGLAVFTGYASGDVMPIGQWKRSGWSAVRRVSPPKGRAYWDDRASHPGLNFERYLEGGGDPNWQYERLAWRPTLLMHHALFLKVRDVDLLVEAGADVQALDGEGRCVLHYCSSTDVDAVRRLIHYGADPNAISNRGQSVLLAVSWDRADVVRAILDAGADPDPPPCGVHRMTPLDHASQYVVDPAMIRHLVGAGGRWNWAVRDGSTPLHKLAASNILDRTQRSRVGPLIETYVESGFDINSRDSADDTPLCIALRKHAQELAERVAWVQHNEDLGGRWDYEHDLMAIRLLECGADPNVQFSGGVDGVMPVGGTPLMIRRYDDVRLVEALLKHGADPLATDEAGRTAMDHVLEVSRRGGRYGTEGCEEVVRALEQAVRPTP